MNPLNLKVSLYLFIVTATLLAAASVLPAAEDKEAISGHIYCVLPTSEGVRLEPGICPGGNHPHVVKTQDGRLILLQESPILKDIPKLTAEQKKNIEMQGRFVGKTTFNPESVRWPWLR